MKRIIHKTVRLVNREYEKPIRTVCQYCRAVLVDVPENGQGVSHGLCKPCALAKTDLTEEEIDEIIAKRKI
jgi:hypothetical protein